jgi:GTP-binding protein HflX
LTDHAIDHRPPTQSAIVLHPSSPRTSHLRDPEARLAEAVGLARALDLEVRRADVVPLRTATPSTLLGKGKVIEIEALWSTTN